MTLRRAVMVCVVAVALLWSTAAFAQKLVVVVRHAERADGGQPGAGSMTGADPPLSAAGTARAAKLAAMLADAGVKAIYVTEFKRTQDTGQPLAVKIGVETDVVKAADTAGLLAAMKAAHANDVVLVIGHSNTLPAIIKGLGGPAVTIGDDEYDSLFVIAPATGAMTRIRY